MATTNVDVRIQVHITPGEFQHGSVGSQFMRLKDSGLGHSIVLGYNYAAQAFILQADTGQHINMPQGIVDATFGFVVHCDAQGDGTYRVSMWHQNTFYGTFNTPSAWNFDTFEIGVIGNTNNEPINRFIGGIRVGTAPGGSDLLLADPFGASVAPPFDTVTGTGWSVSNGFALIVNSGDLSDIASKHIAAVLVPPGFLTDPGDATISFSGIGGTDWAMCGLPAWQIDNWGIDKLIVPMRGSRRTRDTFLQSLQPWLPYPGDPNNMFLADIVGEAVDGENFVKMNVVFQGKRGGVLPNIRESLGEQIQQISARSVYNINHTIGVWYISKTSEQTLWSRQPIDLSLVNPLQPAAIDSMWVTETDVVLWPGTFQAFQTIIDARVSAMFVARVVWTGQAEEVISGQYYRATKTLHNLLFPVLT
jgi:hypothetical protein